MGRVSARQCLMLPHTLHDTAIELLPRYASLAWTSGAALPSLRLAEHATCPTYL
jgi:hypothetical protein